MGVWSIRQAVCFGNDIFKFNFKSELFFVDSTFAGVFASYIHAIVAIEAALAVLTEAAHRIVLAVHANTARFGLAA